MRWLPIHLPALALLTLAPASALASATAGAEPSPPRLLAERGLIVWDPAAGREHLLITAEIERTPGPAALIVEVPLVPAVEPLEDETGAALGRLFALHAERAKLGFEAFPESRGRAAARILQAADAGSLGGFLEAHAMSAYPGLFAFARNFGTRAFHYVALEVPEAAEDARVLPWTAISFLTPRPFYPLATPNESLAPSAQASRLSLYTLSPELLALTVSEFDTGSAVRLSRADLENTLGVPLLSAFGLDAMHEPLWLQRFEPARLPVGSEDGFFLRIPEPAPKTMSTEASALSIKPHRKRLLVLSIALAFALSVAWAGSLDIAKPRS